jgi:hypothetical protein
MANLNQCNRMLKFNIITLHVFLVVVFHDGNLLAGLIVCTIITLDAAVIRLYY